MAGNATSMGEGVTGLDRSELAQALEAASAAARLAGLPSVDEDKDLVLLGRALRHGAMPAMVSELARKALRLRHRVVERNLPLAYSLARRLAVRCDWLKADDARQVAAMALMQAVARYRPARAASDQGWLSTHVFRVLERWSAKERMRAVTVISVGEDIFREADNSLNRVVSARKQLNHNGRDIAVSARKHLSTGVKNKKEKDSSRAKRTRSKGSQSGHKNG